MAEEQVLDNPTQTSNGETEPDAAVNDSANPQDNTQVDDKAKADDKGTDAPIIPESYELSLPKDSTLDQSFIDSVSAYAKEHGLTQDQAKAQFDREIQANNAFVESYTKEAADIADEWLEDLKSDPDVGGDHFDKSMSIAKNLIEKFGGKDVQEVFDKTGMGNNPAIVKMFVKIGKLGEEDTFENGSVPKKEKTPAEIMYPNG